jgi:hypothetical protein
MAKGFIAKGLSCKRALLFTLNKTSFRQVGGSRDKGHGSDLSTSNPLSELLIMS